jgi:hypothetical protein
VDGQLTEAVRHRPYSVVLLSGDIDDGDQVTFGVTTDSSGLELVAARYCLSVFLKNPFFRSAWNSAIIEKWLGLWRLRRCQPMGMGQSRATRRMSYCSWVRG